MYMTRHFQPTKGYYEINIYTSIGLIAKVYYDLEKVDKINHRLNLIQALFQNKQLREALSYYLKDISDIERLISKIVTARVNGRDLNSLKNSLKIIPHIIEAIQKAAHPALSDTFKSLNYMPDVVNLIDQSISENPPPTITDGRVIREGYDKELDELRDIAHHGKKWVAELQDEERKKTGISSLKINYNKVFGYYIEVSKTNLSKIPQDYIRKQTLVNAERFITPRLKEEEDKILGAEEKLKALEYELFQKIRQDIAKFTAEIQESAELIALLDCTVSFAHAAVENHYTRPEIETSFVLEIKSGRHPVVEKFMKPGEAFIPNDVSLNPENEQIWIITGPNMAGKSTFLRQVGLIVFMAQIGSFVPADNARVGIVDRIFTRVGASDNLASGESTFLIEMNETANILNNATNSSLVLLDEIGRGTSTFDGLAIAWSVAEFLHRQEGIHAKTLFATHFHELTELVEEQPRAANVQMEVKEWEGEILFLHRVVPGASDRSYGVHVAELAGVPKPVLDRANQLLQDRSPTGRPPAPVPSPPPPSPQLPLFSAPEEGVLDRLRALDPDQLRPIEALQFLVELVEQLRGGRS